MTGFGAGSCVESGIGSWDGGSDDVFECSSLEIEEDGE